MPGINRYCIHDRMLYPCSAKSMPLGKTPVSEGKRGKTVGNVLLNQQCISFIAD
jgi:hypothetical protein